ncbi:unnamed protein product [Urochloa decumbens]|uniref:Hydrophobic seed protein domain-containing protein n=1 Tax=Urochloa decumbens TaxID=240449 RepID=A0ABC8WTW4_9POAL
MASKLSLFHAVISLLLFAAAVHGCAPYCGQTNPTPPVESAPSTYAPEPPAPATPVPPSPSPYAPEPPTPTTPATDTNGHRCSVNALELEVCASLLNGLVKVSLPEDREKCCQLLGGLADIDAAACLCTVLKANVLGVSLSVPIDISLSLNRCGGRNCPPGLTCPRY